MTPAPVGPESGAPPYDGRPKETHSLPTLQALVFDLPEVLLEQTLPSIGQTDWVVSKEEGQENVGLWGEAVNPLLSNSGYVRIECHHTIHGTQISLSLVWLFLVAPPPGHGLLPSRAWGVEVSSGPADYSQRFARTECVCMSRSVCRSLSVSACLSRYVLSRPAGQDTRTHTPTMSIMQSPPVCIIGIAHVYRRSHTDSHPHDMFLDYFQKGSRA